MKKGELPLGRKLMTYNDFDPSSTKPSACNNIDYNTTNYFAVQGGKYSMVDDGYYTDRGDYLGCSDIEYMLIQNGN